MVSEDSQHLGRLPEVHRLGDLRDLDETGHRQVPAEIHQLDDPSELDEVVSLRGSQWVRLEERNDHIPQVSKPRDVVAGEILPMVVTAVVGIDLPTADERDHLFEDVPARLALDDGERWLHLPAETHLGTSEERSTETALSVHETHEPSDGEESFLLVFRTPHIVTGVHVPTLCAGYDKDAE